MQNTTILLMEYRKLISELWNHYYFPYEAFLNHQGIEEFHEVRRQIGTSWLATRLETNVICPFSNQLGVFEFEIFTDESRGLNMGRVILFSDDGQTIEVDTSTNKITLLDVLDVDELSIVTYSRFRVSVSSRLEPRLDNPVLFGNVDANKVSVCRAKTGIEIGTA